MSQFEEELNNLKVSKSENGTEYYNKAQLLTVFKDWQPSKPRKELPVVPEDVDKAIKYLKEYNTTSFSDFNDILTTKGFMWLNDFQFKDRRFGLGGLNNKLFILAHLAINGYEVEKSQLFYLKAKELLVVGDYDHVEDLWLDWNKNFTPKKQDAHKFTQQEIDSMETGSYELVPAEVDECSSDTDKLSVEKPQPQLNTAKKYIDRVIRTIKHDGHLGTIQINWILPDLEKVLAAIGGDDEN